MWIIPSGKRYMLVLCGLWFISNAQKFHILILVCQNTSVKNFWSVSKFDEKKTNHTEDYIPIFSNRFFTMWKISKKRNAQGRGGRESPLPSTCNQYKCVHAVALRLSDFQYLSDLEIRTNFGSHNFSQIQVVNPGSSPTLAKLYFLVKSL